MMPYKIYTREEYDYCLTKGFEPLMDKRFEMSHELRVEIQKDKFGSGNKEQNNIRFYHYAWSVYPHICKECGKPLERYSSCFVSHRWSRGAHPEMAYDLRNVDILCLPCHNTWENVIKRKNMRIYPKASKEMEELKKEYQLKQSIDESKNCD